MNVIRSVGFLVVTFFCIGCLPATKVYKNPGDHDRGVRYYRPKPYLFVKPMTDSDGRPVDGYVSIEMQMMPDFSEQYSIHVNSGLGNNKTNITLTDGWRLDALNVNIDSKFDENVAAIAEAVKAIPTLTASAEKKPRRITAEASNIPMGYYEAVLSNSQDCRKRLYGFRYVGFMPFSSCPIEACGYEHQNCHDNNLFALLYEDNKMVFRPLHMAENNVRLSEIQVTEVPQEPLVIQDGDDSLLAPVAQQ